MDLTSYHKAKYGDWAGNPTGQKPDPLRCAEEVRANYMFSQCSRRRGYGPEGAFCKQHSPAAKAERARKSSEKYDAQRQEWRRDSAGRAALKLVEKIAAGHNDPRGACEEFLKEWLIWG